MAQLTLKTGTTQALLSEPVVDGALLAPTDKKSVYLDQGNSRKEIKTGHTIQNSSDVNIADRDTLQFIGNVSVSDDSTNNKTIINVGSGVQSDWAQTNTDTPDYIKNKPTNLVSDANYVHTDNNYDASAKAAVDALGTASTKNVPASGDAASTEVVMGNDSRLTDARNAADVSDWAKASTKPSYAYSEITNTPTLGTAAAKDYTTSVTNTGADSTKLVESGAVRAAIDAAVSSAYHAAGPKTVAELTSALLIEANEGNVYNMTTSGVTSSDFVEGYGYPIRIGDNVGICKINNVYKFDLLSGFVDLSNYVEKSTTAGLLKNDGSVDTTITGAVSANTSAISGIKDGTSIDSFGDVETALADKADKDADAVVGDIAVFDASGNPVDSGVNGDMTTTTATGNPLSFTTKSAQLANNAEIVLEPIQAGSGDPSPSNVRAISGRDSVDLVVCGKNLMTVEQGLYNSDGTKNTSSDSNYYERLRSAKILKLKNNQEYVFSAVLSTSKEISYLVSYRDATLAQISNSGWKANGESFTVPSTAVFETIVIKYNDNTNISVSEISNVQLEEGSQATAYEPYNPATDITLKLNETVYGGTLDVEKGELVVDKGIVDLDSLNWTYVSGNGSRFVSDVINDIKAPTATNEAINGLCSIYLIDTANRVYNHITDKTISANINGALWVYDTNYSDATVFKTAVTGQKLVYELATPYTIQLTPHEISLLLGDNVVTTNGTTINLDYNANGEIASLDDLSGVGESINALSDIVASKIAWKDYTYDCGSMTVGQEALFEFDLSLSKYRPIMITVSTNHVDAAILWAKIKNDNKTAQVSVSNHYAQSVSLLARVLYVKL